MGNFYKRPPLRRKKKHINNHYFSVLKNEKPVRSPFGSFLASRNYKKNHLNVQIRDHSYHIWAFYKENVMHIFITFGVRGEIEPKNGLKGDRHFRGLLKKRLLLSGDSKS